MGNIAQNIRKIAKAGRKVRITGYWGDREKNETSINSCGHIFTFRGRTINRPNGRNDYLLLYVYRGSARFYFGENKYEAVAQSGDIVLYAPREPQHHIYESDLSGEFYYIHFSSDDGKLYDILHMQSSCIYHSVPSSDICDIFGEIISELQNKNKYYKEMCLNLTRQLFIKVCRAVSSPETAVIPSEPCTVVQHITHHFDESLSVDEYAAMCGMSKYHFIRKFGEITHMPPLKYRNKLRIYHACEYLKKSRLSVRQISEKLGFSSPEYFSEAFKKEEGISPTEYRRRNTDKNA